jgi:hypothetical protein
VDKLALQDLRKNALIGWTEVVCGRCLEAVELLICDRQLKDLAQRFPHLEHILAARYILIHAPTGQASTVLILGAREGLVTEGNVALLTLVAPGDILYHPLPNPSVEVLEVDHLTADLP